MVFWTTGFNSGVLSVDSCKLYAFSIQVQRSFTFEKSLSSCLLLEELGLEQEVGAQRSAPRHLLAALVSGELRKCHRGCAQHTCVLGQPPWGWSSPRTDNKRQNFPKRWHVCLDPRKRPLGAQQTSEASLSVQRREAATPEQILHQYLSFWKLQTKMSKVIIF